MSKPGLERGERAEVQIEKDDEVETVEVFDHVSVQRNFYVNSVNGYEEFEASIAEGDLGHGPAPEAVTARVAQLLDVEFRIDVREYGIRVVDMEEDNVYEL